MHSRREIPIDPPEVATLLKLKKYHYPYCIAGKIDSDDAVSFDSLLGANYTKA